MPEADHYALWLVPAPPAEDWLAALIDELAEHHHGPRFAPHITLLGSIVGSQGESALAAHTTTLARQLTRLWLGIQGVDGEPNFFRCLYLRLDAGGPLLAAHALAARLFDGNHHREYRPHASLYYGELADVERQRLTSALAGRLPAEIEVDRLQLVRITAAVSGWRVITEAALG